MTIIKDAALTRNVGIVDVQYPAASQWDTAAFDAMVGEELAVIRKEGETYDREVRFRNDPFFRYYRKFKKTYPVMMQIVSFLLKGRPFPEGEYINSVAFLTELKTGRLLGTHDVDRIAGDCVFYQETEKVPFTGMFNPDSHSYPGDLTGRDDQGVIISMIAGADDRTCIHDDTTHVIYIIFSYEGMPQSDMDESAAYITKFARVLAPNAEITYKIY